MATGATIRGDGCSMSVWPVGVGAAEITARGDVDAVERTGGGWYDGAAAVGVGPARDQTIVLPRAA